MVSKKNLEKWYFNRLKKAVESNRVYDVEKLAEAFVAMVEYKPTKYCHLIEKINKRLSKANAAMIRLWEEAYDCFYKAMKQKSFVELQSALEVLKKSFPAVYKDKVLPVAEENKKRKRSCEKSAGKKRKFGADDFVRRSPRNHAPKTGLENTGVTEEDLRKAEEESERRDKERQREREWKEEKLQLKNLWKQFLFESYTVTTNLLFERLLREIVKKYVASYSAIDYMRLGLGRPSILQESDSDKDELADRYITLCEELIRFIVNNTERDLDKVQPFDGDEHAWILSTKIKKSLELQQIEEYKEKIVFILKRLDFNYFSTHKGISNTTKCMGALLSFVSTIESRHKNINYKIRRETLNKIANDQNTSLKQVIMSDQCTHVINFLMH